MERNNPLSRMHGAACSFLFARLTDES
jgi:hypothetical protein